MNLILILGLLLPLRNHLLAEAIDEFLHLWVLHKFLDLGAIFNSFRVVAHDIFRDAWVGKDRGNRRVLGKPHDAAHRVRIRHELSLKLLHLGLKT